MIPTVLLLALVGGIALPRRLVLVGVGVTLAWAAIVLAQGSVDSFAGVLSSLALAAANALVVLVVVAIVRDASVSY
ncbi:MAG: hypothetical protein WD184_09025 [Acidimicrobiia bacterium]